MDKASILEYFNRMKGGQSGECKKCGRIIKSTGGSTSGLHSHLKSQHKINSLKRELSVETQATTSSSFHIKSKITNYINS